MDLDVPQTVVTAGSVMAALHCYVQPLLLSELGRWWEFCIGVTPGQKKKPVYCSASFQGQTQIWKEANKNNF